MSSFQNVAIDSQQLDSPSQRRLQVRVVQLALEPMVDLEPERKDSEQEEEEELSASIHLVGVAMFGGLDVTLPYAVPVLHWIITIRFRLFIKWLLLTLCTLTGTLVVGDTFAIMAVDMESRGALRGFQRYVQLTSFWAIGATIIFCVLLRTIQAFDDSWRLHRVASVGEPQLPQVSMLRFDLPYWPKRNAYIMLLSSVVYLLIFFSTLPWNGLVVDWYGFCLFINVFFAALGSILVMIIFTRAVNVMVFLIKMMGQQTESDIRRANDVSSVETPHADFIACTMVEYRHTFILMRKMQSQVWWFVHTLLLFFSVIILQSFIGVLASPGVNNRLAKQAEFILTAAVALYFLVMLSKLNATFSVWKAKRIRLLETLQNCQPYAVVGFHQLLELKPMYFELFGIAVTPSLIVGYVVSGLVALIASSFSVILDLSNSGYF